MPPCPQCKSESAFINGRQFVCPECQHLWSGNAFAARDAARVGKDAIGKELTDGDSVPVIKDLKVKGSPSALTAGGVAQVACNFWGPQAGEARSLTESIWVKDSPATSPPLLASQLGHAATAAVRSSVPYGILREGCGEVHCYSWAFRHRDAPIMSIASPQAGDPHAWVACGE